MANSDGLERMKAILSKLGNPEKDLKIFHVAGTNGKGSTSIMIASILEKAGYTVGLYTSPHLEVEYERIQIWGAGEHKMIPAEKYDELKAKVEATADGLSGYGDIHFFEKLTALAYLYFAEEKPDYVVLECGLGGRLDSTNTIEKPLVSVICQVGLEHTDVLGNTIIKIAREKAGIIKPGIPVVSQMMELMVKNIIVKTAEENGCDFYDASAEVGKYRGYEIGMKGEHQRANAATAVEAIKASGVEVPDKAIIDGLATAFNPGRFEIIQHEDKTWVLDGAHNPDAMSVVIDTYNAWARTNKKRQTLVIFGCLQDKNYFKMTQLLAGSLKGASYATVDVDDARAVESEKLGEKLAGFGKNVVCCKSAQEAYEYAKDSNAEAVLVIGSIYLVGEMRHLVSK